MFCVPSPAVALDRSSLPIRLLGAAEDGIRTTLVDSEGMPTQLTCASLPVTRWWIAARTM